MLTNLSKKLLLTLLVVVTSAAGAFSQSGTRVEAQGTDSILFYNNNVKTAALSNTGSFRLGATETFQATALFQLNSASQGFLAPRMTTTDRGNIVAPATGLLIYNTSTNQFDYYDGAAWLSIFSSATGNDGDWTVSGADMYSAVSGNVGIGTSSPDAKLNVEGTWDIGISNTVTGFSAGAIGSLNTVAGNRAIAIGSSVSAGHLGTIVMGDWDGGGAASLFSSANNQFTSRFRGGYRFYTDAASTSTLGIFFTNAGSVGLGTPSPSEKLDVVGNVNYSNALKVNGSFGTAGYLLTSQAGGVNTWTDPATLSSGLEFITEGANSGWRFIGANAANYGDIGVNAVDLSYSSSASTTNGATGDYSTAMGFDATASGAASTAMGQTTIASGYASTAMGYATNADGDYSTAMGYGTTADGDLSTAMGDNSTASGDYSTAMGEVTFATGDYSTAMGERTMAIGDHSTAMGERTTAYSYSEMAVGSNNTSYTPASTTVWNTADRLFVIGNGITGSTTTYSNALTIYKDGKMNINDAYDMPTADGNNLEVLTTNGAGVASWSAPATTGDGIYTGSGTLSTSSLVTHADNDVVFVLSGTGLAQFQVRGMSGFNALDVQSDGDIDLDLGTFFVDASSNNVGIGTTTPLEQIQLTGTNAAIDGSDGVSMLISNSNSTTGSTASINFVTNGGASSKGKTGLIHEDTGSNGIGKLHLAATSTTTLAYKVGVADAKLTVQNDGYVGIGTTSPRTPLAILGNGGAQPVGITQNAVGGTATMELTTQDGAGNQATRLKFGGNGNTPDAVFYSGASGSETAIVHIEGTNGNVGIGTTAPAYKLDVSGEARIGYHGSPDTIPLVPSDFLIVFGESAMHQFGENWGIGPIQGQGTQHFIAQIPIPVGYKARKAVIKTYRDDNNYSGNPHDCFIWSMKNQISQTAAVPFATASVTGDGIAIATFSEIVAHGNAYVGIEVRDIPELPGFPGGPVQEMITGGYVLIQQIVP